ncbi:MAG: (d)CMP kinase [Lentisphaerae bacterium]|nr:MAG: (d)CMP kinase [Lentisphaerota bacterium]
MNEETDLQITIDGPAASGKSTVARQLADRLHAYYIDTGAMYRTLTWCVLEAGIDPRHEPEKIIPVMQESDIQYRLHHGKLALYCHDQPVPDEKIRSREVTANVSHVAKLKDVRDWMLNRQRQSAQLGLIVMEGRDIGTVVFPQARWKFFLTASPEERARRRLLQEGRPMDQATLEQVAREIAERDRIDSMREIAPLRPAPDAQLIDTTGLSIAEVVDELYKRIDGAGGHPE